VFRFTVMTAEGEELGLYAFARPDFEPGDVIPERGERRSLEVLSVVPSDGEDRLPLLVVRRRLATA
jgi:hypothetical protein